jgi:uncharacterized membrane protein
LKQPQCTCCDTKGVATTVVRAVATLVISTMIMLGLSNEARSDFTLCNHLALWLDANLTYGVADDYTSVGAAGLLLPGECKVLIRGPATSSAEYYVAAYPASGVYEQTFDWRMPTDHGLCDIDGEKIFFRSDQPQPCDNRYLALANWLKVVSDTEDFSFRIESEESFTLDQARAAGAQQFLNLLGYNVGPVDGIVGPRTERSLTRYQTDVGLRADGRLTAELVESMAAALRRIYASRKIVLESPKRATAPGRSHSP